MLSVRAHNMCIWLKHATPGGGLKLNVTHARDLGEETTGE